MSSSSSDEDTIKDDEYHLAGSDEDIAQSGKTLNSCVVPSEFVTGLS